MKVVKKVLGGLAVAVLAFSSQAQAVTLLDLYIGGVSDGTDSIGEEQFDITSAQVDKVGADLIVMFFSQYFSAANYGALDTTIGDLFISTNGWHPFGPAPYLDDTASNGEDWEYALVIENRPSSFSSTSGQLNLYSVNPGNIILSDVTDLGLNRPNQEVYYNGAGQSALATGTWTLAPGVFTFQIALSALGISDINDLGFHFTQTCANDVFEGGTSGSTEVPEPASIGLTLLGLAPLLRRYKVKA